MKIKYTASVMVAAGWRSVEITAEAEQVSKGMAVVTKVQLIDGEAPNGYQSRTGAKRQTFNASGIAQREVGKKKRLSTCIVEEVAA
jgi:hypothetical protein